MEAAAKGYAMPHRNIVFDDCSLANDDPQAMVKPQACAEGSFWLNVAAIEIAPPRVLPIRGSRHRCMTATTGKVGVAACSNL
ncbi:hypothetical protein A6R70_21270 [Agrobacterium rubi]|nr:hypothetical protein [Agrobacterium rubi]